MENPFQKSPKAVTGRAFLRIAETAIGIYNWKEDTVFFFPERKYSNESPGSMIKGMVRKDDWLDKVQWPRKGLERLYCRTHWKDVHTPSTVSYSTAVSIAQLNWWLF